MPTFTTWLPAYVPDADGTNTFPTRTHVLRRARCYTTYGRWTYHLPRLLHAHTRTHATPTSTSSLFSALPTYTTSACQFFSTHHHPVVHLPLHSLPFPFLGLHAPERAADATVATPTLPPSITRRAVRAFRARPHACRVCYGRDGTRLCLPGAPRTHTRYRYIYTVTHTLQRTSAPTLAAPAVLASRWFVERRWNTPSLPCWPPHVRYLPGRPAQPPTGLCGLVITR